jgi:hypothetical protein
VRKVEEVTFDLDMETKMVNHEKAPVNFEGLYPEEMDTIPAAKRVY